MVLTDARTPAGRPSIRNSRTTPAPNERIHGPRKSTSVRRSHANILIFACFPLLLLFNGLSYAHLTCETGAEMAPNPKHRIVTWDTGNPVGPVGAIDPGSVEHHSRHHRKKAGFKSLADTWADTTTSHGKLMLTVLGGLAEFELTSSVPGPERDASAQWRPA